MKWDVTNISWRTTIGATLGGFAYEYDALGRITSRSHALGDPSQPSPMSQPSQRTYAYDDFDRLASDGDVAYTYDAAGNRMTRTENGETITYTLGDVQGTIWGYVDSQNNIVARWTYDAWGNVVSEYIAPSVSVLAQIRYRFQGREWSVATGLINFRMKWYDAETGRWLSKDPIGLSGGLNLYAFCGGDPMSFIDPGGLDKDANNKSNSPVPAGKFGPPRRGPSGNTYRADPLGHGTKPGTSAPKDPHIHQTDSRGRTRIFDLDGKPRDKGSKLPKVDIPAFGKAVWDAMKYIRMPLPILLMPPVLDMPPGNLS